MSEFGNVKRIPLQLEQIPQQMQQAFLASEDSRFYEHPGINLIGVPVLVLSGLFSQMRQGASTVITQQVARNFLKPGKKHFSLES